MSLKFKYVNDGCLNKNATTIDEVLGRKRQIVLPYKNVQELEGALKRMNLMNMATLAVNLGIKPCGERARLVRACIDQYNRLVKSYGNAIQAPVTEQKPFDPSSL